MVTWWQYCVIPLSWGGKTARWPVAPTGLQDLLRLPLNAGCGGEVEEQHMPVGLRTTPLDQRGTRIIGQHIALADIGQNMLMPQGNVVPSRVTNFLRKNGRGPVGNLPLRIEKAVRHGQVPAPVVPHGNIGQGRKDWLVLFHGAAQEEQVYMGNVECVSVWRRNTLYL